MGFDPSILFSAKFEDRDGNDRFPVIKEDDEDGAFVLDIAGGARPGNGTISRGTLDEMKERLLRKVDGWRLIEVRKNDIPGEIPFEEGDGAGPDVPVTVCDNCGEEVPLYNGLVNSCPMCEAEYSGTGQRLKKNHRTASKLAQERGRDPGVGRPGYGPVRR